MAEQSALWWSSQRALITLFGAAITCSGTFLVCYLLWLADGCNFLLPFISDLGLSTAGRIHTVFTIGLNLGAILFGISLVDIWLARHKLLNLGTVHDADKALNCAYTCLNYASGAAGFAISLGVGAIGYFPWDVFWDQHMLCAETVFFGGTAWSVANFFLLRRISRAKPVQSLPGRPTLLRIQRMFLAISIVALPLGVYSLSCAPNDIAAIDAMLQQAHDDFIGYCHNKQMDYLGWTAFFEWLLVLSLLGSVPCVYMDLRVYFDMYGPASETKADVLDASKKALMSESS